MIFRQLFDPETSTFTYLLGNTFNRAAILIDPVESQVDGYIELLNSLELKLCHTVETHLHADHITGASLLKDRLGCKILVHRDTGIAVADIWLGGCLPLNLDGIRIQVLHTPGHTPGCISLVINDCVFTGDALLIDGCGRTDLPQGNAGQLYDSIHGKLLMLPSGTRVFPGHDYKGRAFSTIGREKASNSRLNSHITRDDFIELMARLDLPYPKLMDIAIPANLNGGRRQANRSKSVP
jgi:sulfur dioxygenase